MNKHVALNEIFDDRLCLTLLIIAVPFLLVQLDIIKADWLRLEPAVILIVIAVTVILMILVQKRKENEPFSPLHNPAPDDLLWERGAFDAG